MLDSSARYPRRSGSSAPTWHWEGKAFARSGRRDFPQPKMLRNCARWRQMMRLILARRPTRVNIGRCSAARPAGLRPGWKTGTVEDETNFAGKVPA